MKSRDILKKLLPVAEETISRINENNIQSHQNWLKSYEKILKTMLENLRQKANEQDTLSGLWRELDNYTEKFFQLNDSINFMLKR